MPIRILIADDHGVVAEGLKHLVEAEADMEVVACVGDGREAVQLAREAQPDVVLMDLSMPVCDGVEATRRIADASPDVHVVILTSFAEQQRVLDALEAGAVGYLLKDADPDDVIAGIRAAHAAGCMPIMVPDLLPPSEEVVRLALHVVASLDDVAELIDTALDAVPLAR